MADQLKNHILSKSEQAKKYLLDEIRSRRYAPGTCIPSDNEFSEMLGLSRSTVREALSALVSEGYIERIQGKGTFVIERDSGKKTSGIITVVAPDVRRMKEDDPFLGLVLRGVLSGISNLGQSACLSTFSGEMSFREHVRKTGLTPSMKQGIIFAGYSVTREDAALLKSEGIPAVSIGRPLADEIPYVECDHFNGARKITEELIRMGHRKISFFDNSHHVASFQERRRGWMQAMSDAGLPASPRLLGETHFFEAEELRKELRKFLEGVDCTAFIVWGDVATFTAVEVLREREITIPKDMSLYMYDGSQWVHQAAGIRISMATSPVFELASGAGSMLHEIIDGRKKIRTRLMDIRFTEGKTLAKPRR